ncbi:lysis protein [Enterobacillus tribolii]|uniref:Prophage endopeptidase n=1 Tax=Enterobacillus tribolii TaxID=1487935 RepID=A0A370QQ84_9GAMM|nr:lysis protein [Enterobacillus tribolii]MBW7981553.1 lysis protein [Enterobacillus tribolii]RDK90930.1 prophage endopeptidase [Enterobacillus tribolii]
MSGLTWKMAAGATLMLGLVVLGSSLNHYRKLNDAAQREITTLKSELDNAYAALQTQQALQNKLRELDARYTGELADAKTTIESLERDVLAGKRRLQLNAACVQRPMPAGAAAAGVADDGSPRLNDAAQRDYFTLRERIDAATIQIKGLQEYIRTQCR